MINNRTDRTNGLSDPFCEFAPGDMGTDVVVDTDDISAPPKNADLSLIRCVRNGNVLRTLEDRTFLRRLVRKNGTAIGGIPPDADSETEQLSVLIDDSVPVSFVQLENSSGENVVTMVMQLRITLNKFELLTRLANVADSAADTSEAVTKIKSMLEELHDLDEPETTEYLIKRRFF